MVHKGVVQEIRTLCPKLFFILGKITEICIFSNNNIFPIQFCNFGIIPDKQATSC